MDLINEAQLGKAFILWVFVAVIMEESGNSIFNWKIYKENLGGKGLKTPIMIALAVFICASFDVDIFREVLGAVGIAGDSNWISLGISALLLSGGSGTAFRVLERLRQAGKKAAE